MFLRREHLAALVVAVSLAAVSGPALAQSTQTHFTAQHAIHFSTGTDQDRKMLSAILSARDIVAQPFEIAREDLNDDGLEEVILMGTSSYWCGSGGCTVVVLDNRAGKWVPIRENQNLYRPLVVTNEKIGEYRALAAVDDKGVIALGDRPGTPMSGKQLVYAMKDYETAAQAEPPRNLSFFGRRVGSPDSHKPLPHECRVGQRKKAIQRLSNKAGGASAAVGFRVGEQVWTAQPIGEPDVVIELQKWRTGSQGASTKVEWKLGEVQINLSSANTLVTTTAEFSKVR
jgi:hypothetical protein